MNPRAGLASANLPQEMTSTLEAEDDFERVLGIHAAAFEVGEADDVMPAEEEGEEEHSQGTGDDRGDQEAVEEGGQEQDNLQKCAGCNLSSNDDNFPLER